MTFPGAEPQGRHHEIEGVSAFAGGEVGPHPGLFAFQTNAQAVAGLALYRAATPFGASFDAGGKQFTTERLGLPGELLRQGSSVPTVLLPRRGLAVTVGGFGFANLG